MSGNSWRRLASTSASAASGVSPTSSSIPCRPGTNACVFGGGGHGHPGGAGDVLGLPHSSGLSNRHGRQREAWFKHKLGSLHVMIRWQGQGPGCPRDDTDTLDIPTQVGSHLARFPAPALPTTGAEPGGCWHPPPPPPPRQRRALPSAPPPLHAPPHPARPRPLLTSGRTQAHSTFSSPRACRLA